MIGGVGGAVGAAGALPGKAGANAADAEIAWLRAELDTAREVIRVQGELSALLERL